MSWFEKCIATYDNNIDMAGKCSGPITVPLVPMFFIGQKVNVSVTVNEAGDFVSAYVLAKDEQNTIIPATEESGGRSRGIAPHPFCDKLGYLAFQNLDGKDYQKKHDAYMAQLQEWSQSPDAPILVKSVFIYLCKGTLLEDLRQQGILQEDFDVEKEEKTMVRFSVLLASGESVDCWNSPVFFESFARYYVGRNASQIDLCYVSGKHESVLHNHPKGVWNRAYGAKIISANDNAGFTFRGRFSNRDEAFIIGNVPSQKAHNALRWVIANQGTSFGNRVFVAWNSSKINIPKPMGFLPSDEEEEEEQPSTQIEYREKINKALSGYGIIGSEIDKNVQIMAFEAATTGRLSVTYYNELDGSDYLQRLQNWYGDCCWEFWKNDKKVVRSPSAKEIVDFAYGTQQSKFVEASDQVRSEHIQTLLHCIVDNAFIPMDIVRGLVSKCQTRQAYSSGNYERLLSITSAILKKHYKERQKKEIEMKLDISNTDRSYLFGRLLAVAEKIERDTYSANEQDREPNAIRLQAAFVQHPMYTWKNLEGLLNPYYAKLPVGMRVFYKNYIGEILSSVREEDVGILNKQLEDTYILGYYLQRKDFYTAKN